ncbi:biliverdin-producing heme oxygenase [Xanthomonas maliensis]|uniref:biliverdin-producing heme oxygenase n=1 Tax=Xanthomonas maliensis TaxID=1321368 RepID=UPI00039BF724|nr:biliverdin-producing heme oxygenase [Xanthomonas maliensis]KAB7766699.1 biliverdin-producing heme oxygenase [Xanthomonas maliensis]
MHSDTLAAPPSAALLLRHATQEAHRRVEAVPAMQLLAQGRVDAATYGWILRRHHALLAGFEAQLGDWLSTLAVVGWSYRRRSAALREDLQALGQPLSAAEPPPLAAVEAARWGQLYVVEGSQLGGRVIARALRQRQPSLANALRYFELGEEDAAGWRRFQGLLEQRLDSDSARAAAVVGAHSMFAHFHTCLTNESHP